jgi:3'-5' exoribonuclease
MRYIEDLQENEQVVEHYLCKKKQTFKSKSGKNYLSLLLQDKTGAIDAKIWDLNNNVKNFEENDFVKIDGTVLLYQNELQLRIIRIRKSEPGEYDENNYIPTTSKNVEELFQEILKYVNGISNPFLKKALEIIFIENAETGTEFQKRSAAKTMHHSYMGGLIEHTLSVAQICDFMSGRYKFVNRDVLIASALLHDIGKIYEISKFPDNDYTDDGQLLGHIMIGYEIFHEAAKRVPGFPPGMKKGVKHCILSHHGEYIYGSPKRPKTIEAFILHCADNMDAKVKIFEEAFEKDNTQGAWIGYSRLLERYVRKSVYE